MKTWTARVPALDISNQKFGQLTAIERASAVGVTPVYWWVVCACGHKFRTIKSTLTRGITKQCLTCGHKRQGLLVTRHGMHNTREYRKYSQAKSRCQCPTNARYKDYGGRGIKFLFTSFAQFFAELGVCPLARTLDRINNDGNYEPGNVRWATNDEQVASRRPGGFHVTPRTK
jgi:hypothetical protein